MVYGQYCTCVSACSCCVKLHTFPVNCKVLSYNRLTFTIEFAIHYTDVIMGAMASQIPSPTIVYLTVIQAQIKGNIKALRHWPLCGEFAGTAELIPKGRTCLLCTFWASKYWPHDDVIKRKHFPRYWPFVGKIHRSICLTKASDAELWCLLWSAPWINGWVNNREAGNLGSHCAYYDVIVMKCSFHGKYPHRVTSCFSECYVISLKKMNPLGRLIKSPKWTTFQTTDTNKREQLKWCAPKAWRYLSAMMLNFRKVWDSFVIIIMVMSIPWLLMTVNVNVKQGRMTLVAVILTCVSRNISVNVWLIISTQVRSCRHIVTSLPLYLLV